MSEREQPPSGGQPGGSTAASASAGQEWRHDTTPGDAPVGSGAHGYVGAGENYYTTPQYSTQPVAVRRPDALAGLLLLLAGLAAAISLPLQWVNGRDDTGWSLLGDSFDVLGEGLGDLFDSGFWQPMAIILGGGVLFVLGLLVLLPARTHRFLGVLALVVSALVVAAVLVPLADRGFDFSEFDLGFWFAIAVAVLGLLGSLKALLTGPKYATAPATT
jgi:hypothetical protein